MATWTAIITDAGTSLQTNQVKGSTITLTRAVSGAAVTTPSNLAALTEMSSVKQTLSLGTLKMDRVNSQFTVQVNLSNDNVTSKYDLRQIGIFAKDSQTNKEILFAIAQIDVAKPINTPENAPGYNIEWQFTFNNPNDNKMAVIINNESLQEQMTFLQNNVSPSGEVEGSIITINNSANLPLVNLNIYGKSEQGFTNGYQLLNFPPEVSFTTTEAYWGVSVNENPFTKGAGTYTYSCSGTVGTSYKIWAYDSAGTLIINSSTGNITLTEEEANSIVKVTIVIQGLTAGATITGYVYPMINFGSEALPYEPYTGEVAGPNPEYPIEINSVGDSGSVEVGVYSKNLFQVTEATINGVTLSKYDDYYVLNGTATASGNFVTSIGYLPAKTYTLSANNPKNNGIQWSLIDVYSANPYSIIAINDNVNNGKRTVILSESNEYLCRIRIEKDVTYSNFIIKPQLEVGSVATEYEPYKGQSLTLSIENGLPGLPVDNGGNYVDADGQHWVCDEVDLERGVYIQRIVCTEFNGSENWLKSTDNNNNYMYHTSLSANTVGSSDSMCNRLIDAGGTSPLQVEGQTTDLLGYFVSKKYNVLYVNMGYYMTENTADNLKSVLTDKPITVIYPLATPIEIALTTEEMQVYRAITTYEPNTTIMNNIGADMKAQYVPQLYGPLMGMIFNRLNNMIGDVNAALDEINGEVV